MNRQDHQNGRTYACVRPSPGKRGCVVSSIPGMNHLERYILWTFLEYKIHKAIKMSSSSSAATSSNKRKHENGDPKPLAVDCESMGETLWLVKLPEFLGDFIANKEHDEVIGKLKVRKIAPTKANPKGGKSTTVELHGTEKLDDIVSQYTLEEKHTGNDVSMLTFSEQHDTVKSTKTKTGYSLHGSITKSMILRPDGAEYNKLLRERSVKTYMRREIQVDNNAIFNFNNMSHIVNFKPGDAAVMKRQAEEADKANRR